MSERRDGCLQALPALKTTVSLWKRLGLGSAANSSREWSQQWGEGKGSPQSEGRDPASALGEHLIPTLLQAEIEDIPRVPHRQSSKKQAGRGASVPLKESSERKVQPLPPGRSGRLSTRCPVRFEFQISKENSAG